MSRRALIPALLGPAVVVLFGVLASTAGNAGEPTGTGWPGSPICAEGTLAAGERTPTVPARTPLIGSIQPCAGTDPAAVARARWGVALYFERGAIIDWGSIRGFDSATAPTAIHGPAFADEDREFGSLGQLRAACVITAPNQRVACVNIIAAGAARTIVIIPIPVDSAYVVVTPEILRDQSPDPECGACV